MNFTGVPIIITLCYMIAEVYKKIFDKKTVLYKLIPIFMVLLGGGLGTIMYLADPILILNAENIYEAIIIGIMSGATSTCTNQVVKQINKKNGGE